MLKPGFAIRPEGAAAIGLSAFSAILFAILEWTAPAIICWALLVFSLHFFRDPERVPPEEADAAASPADGTVIRIAEKTDPFGGEPRQCISIFMSVFNVHVNRAPIACTVKKIRYIPGAFFNASLDKASEKNERCIWQLEDQEGNSWTLVQIAGLIARRIVCWAEPGDHLKLGERFGMIRFGSRVDLYLPPGYVAAVNLKQKVHAGETIIAARRP